MALQLVSLREFELAKIRIMKIMNANGHGQLVNLFTKIPMIAAINSALSGAEKLVSVSGQNIATSAEVLASIEALVTLYNTDRGFFNLLADEMGPVYAMTNAETPVAWNNSNYVYGYKVTSGGTTQGLESLKALFNYAAAVDINSAGDGATVLNNTGGSGIGPGNLDIFQCIFGQLEADEDCPSGVAQWTDPDAKNQLLTLNVLAKNEFTTTPDGTYVNEGVDKDTGTTDESVIAGLVTTDTGYWDKFDTYFPNIVNTFGAKKKFLEFYNGLDFERAVTRAQYDSFKASIYAWNAYNHLDKLVDGSVARLIDQGVIKSGEANTDLSDSGSKFLEKAAFLKWAAKMPLAGTTTNSIWSELSDDRWFHSFATHLQSGEQLAKALDDYSPDLNFSILKKLEAAGAEYGVYGDGTSTATSENFLAKFATDANVYKLFKAGVNFSNFAAGNIADGTGDVNDAYNSEHKGLGLDSDATLTSREFTTRYDCMFNEYTNSILKSHGGFLWDSQALLAEAIFDNVCSVNGS